MVFPVNKKEIHWGFVIVNFDDHSISLVDSAPGFLEEDVVEAVFKAFVDQLHLEGLTTKTGAAVPRSSAWTFTGFEALIPPASHQVDGNSCGPMSLMGCAAVFLGLPYNSTKGTRSIIYRAWILHSMIHGHILTAIPF